MFKKVKISVKYQSKKNGRFKKNNDETKIKSGRN